MENLKQPYYKQFEIFQAVASVLFNKPYELPKKPLAEALLERIRQSGIQSALKLYEENKKSKKYYLNEGEINGVGYYLLDNLKEIDNALEIFKINTQLFPASANTYDSLAEAYMNKGDKGNAILFYQRSLQLNPGNDNARQMIEKLSQSK